MKILILIVMAVFILTGLVGCTVNMNLRGSFTQNNNKEVYGQTEIENTEETAINADKSTDVKADVKTGGEK
jgi:nucleoside diphosphate kinase